MADLTRRKCDSWSNTGLSSCGLPSPHRARLFAPIHPCTIIIRQPVGDQCHDKPDDIDCNHSTDQRSNEWIDLYPEEIYGGRHVVPPHVRTMIFDSGWGRTGRVCSTPFLPSACTPTQT